jgi:hypothetical protein
MCCGKKATFNFWILFFSGERDSSHEEFSEFFTQTSEFSVANLFAATPAGPSRYKTYVESIAKYLPR